mgnify:CR=1 FL=1
MLALVVPYAINELLRIFAWVMILDNRGLLNVALLYRLWLPAPVTGVEFFANLLLDIFFLSAVLYFSGGPSNPLVSFYLIPVIVSAAVLGVRHTGIVAAAAARA